MQITDDPNPYDDLFTQPFAAYIIRSSGCSSKSKALDLSFLSDTEYESLMSWIYEAGWDILTESRKSITVNPEAHLPPRLWVPLPATATTASPTKSRRRPATIPRFCRHGHNCPDQDTTCHYTHGDTIHCIDEICAFDNPTEGCCCCGEKRKTCIRIHPSEGQIWTPELVVHRPY
jgi:hypothetical protein